VLDHPQQQHRVDVAAGQDRHHRSLQLHPPGQQGGHRRSPGRLDHHLVAFQQHQQGRRELLVGDRDELVDQLADVREVQVAGPQHGDAVGDRGRLRQLHRRARGQ
jgi:hypothetical protein